MKLELDKRPTQVLLVALLLVAFGINLYFLNGRSGAWSQSVSSSLPVSTPNSTPAILLTHEWSGTTYRNPGEAWRCVSDPISAIVDVRNPANPSVIIHLDGTAHIPAEWNAMQWRLSSDDTSAGPVRLMITTIPPSEAAAVPPPKINVRTIYAEPVTEASTRDAASDYRASGSVASWPKGVQPTRSYTAPKDLKTSPDSQGRYKWTETIKPGDDLEIYSEADMDFHYQADAPQSMFDTFLQTPDGEYIEITDAANTRPGVAMRFRVKSAFRRSIEISFTIGRHSNSSR